MGEICKREVSHWPCSIVMQIRDLVLVKGLDGSPRMKSCFLQSAQSVSARKEQETRIRFDQDDAIIHFAVYQRLFTCVWNVYRTVKEEQIEGGN